jgi:hypothetical protein
MYLMSSISNAILSCNIEQAHRRILNGINVQPSSGRTVEGRDGGFVFLTDSKKKEFKLILLDFSMPLVKSIVYIAKTIICFIGSPFSKKCSLKNGLTHYQSALSNLSLIPVRLVFCPLNLIFTCFGKGTNSGKQ